jgi:threonyl-tRNA synthetase
MLVVGDREAESGAVSVRNRKHGDQGVKSVQEFLGQLEQLIADKTPAE